MWREINIKGSIFRKESLLLLFLLKIALYMMSSVYYYENEELLLNSTEQAVMSTEFFTTDDTEKLTIRYFYLDAAEKSGDAILIKSPDGKTMLIDAGIVETGSKLSEYLDNMNIDQLDYAIATHPHHDHIGGYDTILRNKEIGKLMMPNIRQVTSTYKNFIQTIEEEMIDVAYVHAGNQFYLGRHVLVEVISPEKEDLQKASAKKELSTAEINDLSLVLKVTYHNRTFLFTGDIYKKQEKKLVQEKKAALAADFLDAPHHGDKTSSSQEFIHAVHPQITVMSANILQSRTVYNRYKKSGSDVYSTSKNKHILIESDGESIKVSPEYVTALKR
ncbi:ComEC/Rec2 family competence protein [Halalkalibacter urbisdiaboli]|uniref:ComEC/Rec2 family competence protein n=1 Tax=Halalkalibacter urbisdiaboli TaxID=1960589 RepID=UPI000B4327FE|nr:MBL fold metallo-hydrolase [Halalkalibacter urbisdiaboli]